MTRLSAIVAAAAGTALFTLCACGAKEEKAGAAAPPRVTDATVAAAMQHDIPDLLEVVGTVRARGSAVVAARIPGTVTMLRVREGDRVKRGELLGRIESGENMAGAAEAAAAVDEARRGVEEAGSRRKLADAIFDRFARLYAEQAVTRNEFEIKETERDLAVQAVARAEARLKQSREASRGAATLADYTKIVAPLSGIVVAKNIDPGATVFPAQPLLTIEQEGSWRLELAAPESLREKLRIGTPLDIFVDAAPVTRGRVAEVAPVIDPVSRTFTVKVNLPGSGFRSGMFGRAQVALGSLKAVTVPAQSVREQGNLSLVWVVDRENIARMRLVKPGKRVGSLVEVLAGLSAGERVVTAGAEKVAEGDRIQQLPNGRQ